jgi:hypothetical protein
MNKKGWPNFPFTHWEVEKWNMSSLQLLSSHLDEKSQTLRNVSGFRGEPTLNEKQIIDDLSCLRQQLLVLTDVVQALLQIIDEQRPSQKARRAVRRVQEKVKRYWHKAEESVFYKILAFASALATLVLIIRLVIWFFHSIKK